MKATNILKEIQDFYYNIYRDIEKFTHQIDTSFSNYQDRFFFIIDEIYDEEIRQITNNLSSYLLDLNKEDRVIFVKQIFKEIDRLNYGILVHPISSRENENLAIYKIRDTKNTHLVYYDYGVIYSELYMELISKSREVELPLYEHNGYTIYVGFVLIAHENFLKKIGVVLFDFGINLLTDIIAYNPNTRGDYSFLDIEYYEKDEKKEGELLTSKQVLILCLEILAASEIDRNNTKLTELARLLRLITNKGDRVDKINNTGTYSNLKEIDKNGYKDADLIKISQMLNKLGFGALAKKFE